jgi:hypothetical protein
MNQPIAEAKMPFTDRITFVVTVLDRKVLANNMLASPALRQPHKHQIIVQEGFASAAKAYNDGLRRAENELVVFLHSDVYLPETWFSQLECALQHLDRSDPAWGVLGCWGATRDGQYRGHVYSTGWGMLGTAFERPQRVQTLDEVILIFRKSSGLQFDENLPHFHFYGTDICLRAAKRAMTSYAISAFCIHNTNQILRLPKEFYSCYSYIRRAWKDSLPIQTSCIRVSKYNAEANYRRLKEYCGRILGRDAWAHGRVTDPSRILETTEAI